MRKINQGGFSAVLGLLLVVIIAGIGFTGWYVYSSSNKTKGSLTLDNSELTKKTSITVKPNPTTVPTKVTEQKYIEIKEWGVKIPLSSEISDANYTQIIYGTKTNSEGETVYSLYKKSFADISDNCKYTSTYRISRYKNSNSASDYSNESMGQRYGNEAKKIGDYNYYKISPQSACSDAKGKIVVSSEAQLSSVQAFSKAIDNIQAL